LGKRNPSTTIRIRNG